MIVFIDIGGTPAKLIESNKLELAKANGISEKQLIAILDPFDLSRVERRIKYKSYNIKFPINSKEVNRTSETEQVIVPENIPKEIKEIVNNSKNIRELMNNLVKFFYPTLKTIKLEEVLSKNKNAVYSILKKIKIPVRAICPKCNKFKKIWLGDNFMCCNVEDSEIINSGRYVPQEGFLPVITYLCGYKTFSNSIEKKEQIKKIKEILKFKGNPLVNYIKQGKLKSVIQKEIKMETVKGFRDFTGQNALKREAIKEILIRNFKTYGFLPAETPIIEFEEFVKGNNSQDEAISDIFKLQDKGERNLALRYELTFQLKRIAEGKKLPYKRYQIGEVFRDEPTSSNRFRQFTQCDVDVIGSSTRDEAEVLKVFAEILKELGIDAAISINNRKLLNELLEEQGIKKQEIKEQIIREIDKFEKLSESEVKSNLSKYGAEKLIEIFKKPEKYFEKYSSFKEIQELIKYCKLFNLEVEFSPTLARGLSYYNGSVFEIFTKKIKESIAGGGSYLVNGIQSTGISFGLERLSYLAKIDADGIKCITISIGQEDETIKLLQFLRNNGISCLLMDKLSKALEYANQEKIPYVIFIGKDEVSKKKFKLRDMKTGKEEFLIEKDLVKKLKK